MEIELVQITPDQIRELDVEALAQILLHHLDARDRSFTLHRVWYQYENAQLFGVGTSESEPIVRAFSVALAYLQHGGLIARTCRDSDSMRWFVTDRGRQVAKEKSFADFQKSQLLPKGLLHPAVAKKSWAEFIKGDYDTAVFKAFKEVEIAVRAAGGFKASDLGVKLMRECIQAKQLSSLAT